MGELQERITSTKKGSITSLQAVYVPADDYSDPAPVVTFAHLDATISLERSLAAQGLYPAVDPLASTSRILDPVIVGEEHYQVAREERFLTQPFKVAETFTGIPGVYVPLHETVRGFKEILEGKHDHLPEQAFYMVGTIDEAVEKARKMGAI